jgi:hypothetical protein
VVLAQELVARVLADPLELLVGVDDRPHVSVTATMET